MPTLYFFMKKKYPAGEVPRLCVMVHGRPVGVFGLLQLTNEKKALKYFCHLSA